MKANSKRTSIISLINKKKDGISLSKDDFTFFVKSIKDGTIDSLQIGAFLGVLSIKNINEDEIKYFIQSLQQFGTTFNVIKHNKEKKYLIDYIAINEFSDSLDLILGPIVSSINVQYNLIYTRSLNFNGSIFNKLDSIGVTGIFNNVNHLNEVLYESGLAIIENSKVIEPFEIIMNIISSLDIDNYLLKVALVLAYKFNIENTLLIINLKFGELGIVKTIQSARKLAQLMLNIADSFNKKIIIIITNADALIGRYVGTALEVKKAVEFLTGDSKFADYQSEFKKIFSDICYRLNLFLDKNKVSLIFDDLIKTKKALNTFNRFLAKQRSKNLIRYNNYRIHKYYSPKHTYSIKAKKDGFIYYKDYKLFKNIALDLNITNSYDVKNKIDYQAGMYFNKIAGEEVKKDDVIMTIYSSFHFSSDLIDKLENNFEIFETRQSNVLKNFTQDIYDNLKLIKVVKFDNN